MLKIKDGVDLVGVTVPMLFATVSVHETYVEHSYECIITTGRDGYHGRASLHFSGNALDYRMKHIKSDTDKINIYNEVKVNLGGQYDVVLHPYVSDDNPGHLHVEFQPKDKR